VSAHNRSNGGRDGRRFAILAGCCSWFPPTRSAPRWVDEHFAAEATAARDAGIAVALIDHDALADPGGAQRADTRSGGWRYRRRVLP
jgi:hypothetical protein